MRRPISTFAFAVTVVASVLLVGCSKDDTSTADANTANTTTTATMAKQKGSIVVSAAASLTGSFDAIKKEFVAANPDVEVTINYGSSGQLSTQIVEGAPVDVAAFADTAPMDAIAAKNLLAGPAEVFVTNRLTIVTKPGNPLKIKELSDLTRAGVVSLCVETAPCGKFADAALESAGVVLAPEKVSRGQDVKATVTAVTEGDAEAGIVYVTDATAVGSRADAVAISDDLNVVAKYPIAVLAGSKNASAASAFVEFVRGPEGRKVLESAGFGAP